MARLRAVVSVLTLTLHQVLAQSILDDFQCAGADAISKIKSTNCPPTDIKCFCKDQSLINSILPIVKHKCSPDDFQKIVNATESFCGTASVTIPLSLSPLTVFNQLPTVPAPTPTVPKSTPTRPPSTPTTNSTAKPRVIPTFTVFSKITTRTSSIAPFRNSTSSKPTAPPSPTANPTPKPSPFKGAANRNSATYIWAAFFLGTTVLLLV